MFNLHYFDHLNLTLNPVGAGPVPARKRKDEKIMEDNEG